MKGMTVTVQFKAGQFDAAMTTVTGVFNTMLDKGKFSMSETKTIAPKGTKENGGGKEKGEHK